MQDRSPNSRGEEWSAARTEALRSVRHRGLQLLPGATLLFAFQLFVAQSGALNRLQPNEQAAFAVSLGSSALSIVLLTILVLCRDVAKGAQKGYRQVEITVALLLTGTGALAGALAGDYFVVGSRLGSPNMGGVLAAMILLLIYAPSL